MPVKRTTHRSTKGTKLYAVRDSKGRFKDIQTYKRAHGMDIKRGSKAEKAAKGSQVGQTGAPFQFPRYPFDELRPEDRGPRPLSARAQSATSLFRKGSVRCPRESSADL
jgi:hypothetical protein